MRYPERHDGGNACLGLVIASFLTIPAYCGLAAGIWFAVGRLTSWRLTYWQVLGMVLIVAGVAGAIITLVGLRKKKGSIS